MIDYMFAPFRKYAVFQGRARRSEFWYYTLFIVLVSIVLAIVDGTMMAVTGLPLGVLGLLFSLATIVPSIAVTIRRLHDTDRSGWWILIAFIPIIGAIVLLVFEVLEGTAGPNKFGPSPKMLGAEVFS